MENLIDILLVLLPALLVLIATYLLLKSFFRNESEKRRMDLKSRNQETITPIRLQAYERLVLLMERLTPNSLIMRVKKSGMTAADLQVALLAEVRAEFDHNLSQQLYVSKDAWSLVKNAKEEIVKLINLSYSKVDPKANALDLSKAIFDQYMEMEKSPTQKVILYIKKEAQEMF